MLGRGIGPNRKEDMSPKERLRRVNAAMAGFSWYELSAMTAMEIMVDRAVKMQTMGHGLVNRFVDFGGDSYHTVF